MLKEIMRMFNGLRVISYLVLVKKKKILNFGIDEIKVYCRAAVMTLLMVLFKRNGFAPRIRIILGLSLKCNVKCVFCLAHSSLIQSESERISGVTWQLGKENSKQEVYLGFETLKVIVDDLQYLEPKQISLAGNGETLLYPNIVEALTYIRSKPKLRSTTIYISTNGLMLSKHLSEELFTLGVDRINFSINAAKAETYGKIHSIDDDAFGRVITNIRNYVSINHEIYKNKSRMTASFVLCKINYKEIVDMVNLCCSLGIKSVGFMTMYFCKGKEDSLREYILSKTEKKELEEWVFQAILQAKKKDITSNLNSLLNLLRKDVSEKYLVKISNGYTCQIHANGIVNPYDFPEKMGNVCQKSILEIWYSKEYCRFRNMIKEKVLKKGCMPTRPFCFRCDLGDSEKSYCNVVF